MSLLWGLLWVGGSGISSLKYFIECVHAKLFQSYPTLCNPMDCSLQGSCVHGILQARILEWIAMPCSRGSSQSKDQTHVSLVQPLSRVRHFVTPWTAAHQASPSITNSQSLLKLMSIAWEMPSNHLIICHPLLLPPSIFPNIKVFSKDSVLCIRWPKYWNFSFSINPANEYSGLISFRMDW